MSITYRHIPKGWNTFILPDGTNRKPALCGVRTTPKYMGIPGMTPQATTLRNAAGKIRPGWCPVCIKELLNWYRGTYQKIPMVASAQAVYEEVFWEMFFFMRQWNEQDSGNNLTQS